MLPEFAKLNPREIHFFDLTNICPLKLYVLLTNYIILLLGKTLNNYTLFVGSIVLQKFNRPKRIALQGTHYCGFYANRELVLPGISSFFSNKFSNKFSKFISHELRLPSTSFQCHTKVSKLLIKRLLKTTFSFFFTGTA